MTPIPVPADSALSVCFLRISKSYPSLGTHPALFRENYFPTLFGRCFLPEQLWLSDGCLFQESAGGPQQGPCLRAASWHQPGPPGRTQAALRTQDPDTSLLDWLFVTPSSPRTPAPQCGTLFGFPKKPHWEKENFGETLSPEDYAPYSLHFVSHVLRKEEKESCSCPSWGS